MEKNFENNSFMFKLGKFCKNVDAKVSELKKNSENISGSNPQNYDKGLKVFKSELQNLRTLSEDAKHKIGEIQQFSSFTTSLQEIVSQQEDEIQKMENYLKKFGYIVPEILEKKFDESSTNLNEVRDAPDEQANMLDAEQRIPFSNVDNGLLMTPELSDVGKLALQGKRLPLLEIWTANTGKGSDTTVTDHSSPTCTKSLAFEATPTSSGIKNIQNWLAGVHAEANFAITPNVITERPVKPMRQRAFQQTASSEFSKEKENVNSYGLLENINKLLHKSRFEPLDCKYEACDSAAEINDKIDQKSYIFPKENQFKRFTPEEPVLSTVRNLNIKKDYFTPEEPILNSNSYSTAPNSNFHSSLKESRTEHFTPDEPVLTIDRNPSIKKVYPTPEEPVISSLRNIAIKKCNVEEEEYYTPEEPSRNCGRREFYYTANNNAAHLINTPQSPQLSDVTQKILNIRNLRFSVPNSNSSLPEKNQSSIEVNYSKRAL